MKVNEIQWIICPKCGEASDSIKCYGMFEHIVFLVFGASARRERVCACPSCMRKYILKKMLIQLFTANLLWPLFVALPLTIKFFCTYTKGHSAEVYQMLENHGKE